MDTKTDNIFQAIRLKEPLVALLGSLAEINIKNENNQSLLHEAIAWKNAEAVGELLRRGIDVNIQDSTGRTPLHYACEHSDVTSARLILVKGGKLNIADENGNTPVWTAVFNSHGNYDMLRLFLEFGGKELARCKNASGKSPFDLASVMGEKTIVELLS